MKRIILIMAMGLLAGQSVFSQIQFENGNWQEVQAKASREQKLIFVDVYAVWCGPCKVMDKKVFTQQKVADHFNTNFVNYKVDAEKGEGVGLVEKYRINGFPTYMYINGEGELVHKIEGAMSAEKFIAESKKALGK